MREMIRNESKSQKRSSIKNKIRHRITKEGVRTISPILFLCRV